MPVLSLSGNFVSSNQPWVVPRPRRKICRRLWRLPSAEKPEVSDSRQARERAVPLNLRASKPLVARAAVAVLGLGFVDAGYSGDWSRIGVISKETEELLKAAALVVVPLCLFVIYSIRGEKTSSGS